MWAKEDLEKVQKRIQALDELRNEVDKFPKTGQGYQGIGIVEPENLKEKTKKYSKLVFEKPETLKDMMQNAFDEQGVEILRAVGLMIENHKIEQRQR